MPITIEKCPHCGSSHHQLALAVGAPENDTYAGLIHVSFPPSVNYLTCTGCGLTFRDQIFSAQEATSLYASAYRQHILKDMSGDDYFNKVINIPPGDSELDAKITNLKLLIDGLNIHKVIDIGCGVGAFLYKLRAAVPELIVEGIEPTTEFAVVAARRNDTKIINKDYDGFSLEAYDLVTCVHVLEHTPAPWDFLVTISSNMKPGAYFYLETPSVEDIQALPADHDRFMSPHNYLFSKEFITAELSYSGFRPLTISYAPTRRGKVDLRAFAVKS
jgi:2-polyprenyl-3-methyl-5-hydroxy-6-metoxy-1,4-benzoquinol methylase